MRDWGRRKEGQGHRARAPGKGGEPWDDGPPRYANEEDGAVHRGGSMPVHPDTRGHEMLAEAIMPRLLAALGL